MSGYLKLAIENFALHLESIGEVPYFSFNLNKNKLSVDVIKASNQLYKAVVKSKDDGVDVLILNGSCAATNSGILINDNEIVMPIRLNGIAEEFIIPLHRLMSVYSIGTVQMCMVLNPDQSNKTVMEKDIAYLLKLNADKKPASKNNGNIVPFNGGK